MVQRTLIKPEKRARRVLLIPGILSSTLSLSRVSQPRWTEFLCVSFVLSYLVLALGGFQYPDTQAYSYISWHESRDEAPTRRLQPREDQETSLHRYYSYVQQENRLRIAR